MEWDPYWSILLIVRIVQFLDTNAILMILIHFLAKMNSGSITPAIWTKHVIVCYPWNTPYSPHHHSPDNIQFLYFNIKVKQ